MAQTRREGAVVRLRISVIALMVLVARSAEAQPGAARTGLLSGYIGAASGDDTATAGLTLAGAMAVMENSGWGAELDLGFSRGFAGELFDDSEILTLMVNAVGMRPVGKVRPYGMGGVGLLRVHLEPESGADDLSRNDWGFNAGGGAIFVLNEALGIRGDLHYFRYFQRHDDLDLTQSGTGSFGFWRTSIGITWSWPIR
jgi:opacity protein-like surface antigen